LDAAIASTKVQTTHNDQVVYGDGISIGISRTCFESEQQTESKQKDALGNCPTCCVAHHLPVAALEASGSKCLHCQLGKQTATTEINADKVETQAVNASS